ncbi:MAG TPA: ribosome maturation factor RimM [Candidatus Polarisedimenticolaceae bacterium]|nr:ribosome maturation factor RimM [Candidatus Polarisedimenticolaceae bacterium]
MSRPEGEPLVLGRVSGFRGNRGEVTVSVISGDAARWTHLRRVWLDGPREVESSRAYGGRLVLKLAGVDDANAAAALRGRDVAALAADVPALPEGVYWSARLVGATVTDRRAGVLGRVCDVMETGGTDLLVVRDDAGVETLVPLARSIVSSIDASQGAITVVLPEGLRDLGADDEREPS